MTVFERFVTPEILEKPMLLEVFTSTDDESEAYKLITTLSLKSKMMLKGKQILSNTEMKSVEGTLKKLLRK